VDLPDGCDFIQGFQPTIHTGYTDGIGASPVYLCPTKYVHISTIELCIVPPVMLGFLDDKDLRYVDKSPIKRVI
jgi:hypothetical protein